MDILTNVLHFMCPGVSYAAVENTFVTFCGLEETLKSEGKIGRSEQHRIQSWVFCSTQTRN